MSPAPFLAIMIGTYNNATLLAGTVSAIAQPRIPKERDAQKRHQR